jgi:hypothetical protein
VFEKSKEMWETFRYVEQVSRDKNPIRVKLAHSFDDTIVPLMIPVQVQISQMHGPMTGKSRMDMG